MAESVPAELLVDAGFAGQPRRPALVAGTVGRARPLYRGADRWIFEAAGERVVVPRAALRLLEGDGDAAELMGPA
jgi:hypothetical protein